MLGTEIFKSSLRRVVVSLQETNQFYNAVFHSDERRSRSYFASCSTQKLLLTSAALKRREKQLSKVPPYAVAELMEGLLSELNLRGLFAESSRLVEPLVWSPNSFLRMVKTSTDLGSQLVNQVATTLLANFYLANARLGASKLVSIDEDCAETTCASLGKLTSLMNHEDTTTVQALAEVHRLFTDRSDVDEDRSYFCSKEDDHAPMVKTLQGFYMSHPLCVEYFPRWLQMNSDIVDDSKYAINASRLEQLPTDLRRIFDATTRKFNHKDLELLADWGHGSTVAEIKAMAGGMHFPPKRSSLFSSERENSERYLAYRATESFLQSFVEIFIYCARREPEQAFAQMQDVLREAQVIPYVGTITSASAYGEFVSKSAHKQISGAAFEYWVPTHILRILSSFVESNRYIVRAGLGREFHRLVAAYNISKSKIAPGTGIVGYRPY